MFVWINNQGVRSDHGFVVQHTGRFTLEYRDVGKTATLEVEAGNHEGRQCLVLSSSAFRAWDDGAGILDADRKLLIENLRQALEFQGLGLVVDEE